MKLATVPRAANKKSEINRLRREGFVPAILYVKGKEGETLAIKSSDFSAHLRHVRAVHQRLRGFHPRKEDRRVPPEVQVSRRAPYRRHPVSGDEGRHPGAVLQHVQRVAAEGSGNRARLGPTSERHQYGGALPEPFRDGFAC